MIPTHGATRSWVSLWPFLMSIHGVAFTMTAEQCTLFLFGQSHRNHTYHCRNPSPYHPSHYGSASSFVSRFGSFAWPRLVHSPVRHTPVTVMGQANAQIWAPMSSTRQILSSTMTCSYFPRVTHVAYDRRLLHGSKEDEATLMSYMYNSQHCQSQLRICVLLIPHHQH
jgi:hypothetical protein